MATSTAKAWSTRAGAPSCRYDQSTRCTGWWIGASAGRRPRGRTSSRRTRSAPSRTASVPGARPRSASRRRPSPASTTRTPRTSPSTRLRRRLPLRGLKSSRRALRFPLPPPRALPGCIILSSLVAGSRADAPREVPSRFCSRTSSPSRREGLVVAILRLPSARRADPNPNALLQLRAEHKALRVKGLGIS